MNFVNAQSHFLRTERPVSTIAANSRAKSAIETDRLFFSDVRVSRLLIVAISARIEEEKRAQLPQNARLHIWTVVNEAPGVL